MARKPIFVRKDTFKISRLGKRRKKKQKWRRPRGRHAKLREKRGGHRATPSIGYGAPAKTRGFVDGLKPVLVHTMDQLNQLKAGEIAVIGRVGAKKKIELAKAALSAKIKLLNLNAKKFLEKIEKKQAKKKKEKEKKEKQKAEKVKKEEKKVEEEKAKEKTEEVEGGKEKTEKGKEMLKETPLQKSEIKRKMEFEE